MKIVRPEDLLVKNSYPGRGIILGLHADEKHAVVAYFIMGRSENSRNRIFVEDCGGIRTQAFDPAKLTDPSLIIYHPVRVLGSTVIVTNGDQTDTVFETMQGAKTFEDALRTRTFEPDSPNFTPRISGALQCEKGQISYRLSILKSAGGNPRSVQRMFFEYPQPLAGEGHFIHTYRCDGDPLPSFAGEPELILLDGNIDALTKRLWESLDAQNKVSLFVRYINRETGRQESRIENKHH